MIERSAMRLFVVERLLIQRSGAWTNFRGAARRMRASISTLLRRRDCRLRVRLPMFFAGFVLQKLKRGYGWLADDLDRVCFADPQNRQRGWASSPDAARFDRPRGVLAQRGGMRSGITT